MALLSRAGPWRSCMAICLLSAKSSALAAIASSPQGLLSSCRISTCVARERLFHYAHSPATVLLACACFFLPCLDFPTFCSSEWVAPPCPGLSVDPLGDNGVV